VISQEVCPFENPEYLSAIAENVNQHLSARRSDLTSQLLSKLDKEQTRIFNEIDELSLQEINEVQAATVKKTICEPCRRSGTPCRNPEP
jgi:hypothetical protein